MSLLGILLLCIGSLNRGYFLYVPSSPFLLSISHSLLQYFPFYLGPIAIEILRFSLMHADYAPAVD